MGGKQSKALDSSSTVIGNLQQQGEGVDGGEVSKNSALGGSSGVSLDTKNTKRQSGLAGINLSNSSTTIENPVIPQMKGVAVAQRSKDDGELRQPEYSKNATRPSLSQNYTVHDNGTSLATVDKKAQLQLGKMVIPQNNARLETARPGVEGETTRGQVNVSLNNISAAANIMGETERKSIKLAAVENVCSEILPFLFVSGEAVARDLSLLKAKGITHIINCAGIECRNHFESDFHYITIKLADNKTSRIDRYVYVLINEIESVRKNGGRVLIHCWQGVSRSTSIVVAYLMWKDNIDFENAKCLVRKVRNVTRPNMGFQCQLMQWQRLRTPVNGKMRSRLYALVIDRNIDGISSNVLPHLCLKENSSEVSEPKIHLLDPRGCFLLYSYSNSESAQEQGKNQVCVYRWKGPQCEPDVAAQIDEEVQNIFLYLTQNEPTAKLVYIKNKAVAEDDMSLSEANAVKGSASDEAQFWSLFGEPANAAARVIKRALYDSFWNADEHQQSTSTLGTIDENQIENCPSDETDGGEICLYKYSGSVESFESKDKWEHLYGYEWEDLGENNASEDVFLIANKSTAYIFVGAKCSYQWLHCGSQTKILEIVNDVTIEAGKNTWEGPSVTLIMEKDGLSNDFCDFFEKGM